MLETRRSYSWHGNENETERGRPPLRSSPTMPTSTSTSTSARPTPLQLVLLDARARAKRDSLLRPEDAWLLPKHLMATSNTATTTRSPIRRGYEHRQQHTTAMHQNRPQTRHDSLSNLGPQRPSRSSYQAKSAPSLVVYKGNRLGSIVEEEHTPAASPPLLADVGEVIKKVTSKIYRPVDWRKLPAPIFECILDQLQCLHQADSCSTCYMRDLCSMQMTCKSWFSESQRRLYRSISIDGDDLPEKLAKMKLKYGARLTLLRRTLRRKTLLANLVKELTVPDPIIPLYRPRGDPNPEYDEYLCLLASIVMICPNLEKFEGFYPFYNHTFDRLTHALSTRDKLKQHVWIIAENAECTDRARKQLPPGILDSHQTYQFLQYHDRWSSLETLLICSPGSLGVLEHDVFIESLHSLPRLKNLCISSFDADDFHDGTLLALPHVRRLRLEECPGVSDAGLMRWSSSPNSVLIENLSLIHQNLTSLLTIARLMAGLERLTKFSILQSDVQPTLPLDTVVFHPIFASKTLSFLHWDIAPPTAQYGNIDMRTALQEAEISTPNTYLALSLLHHGFPALKRLRTPRDIHPRGALQAMCRPAKRMNVLSSEDSGKLEHRPRNSKDSNNLLAARYRAQNSIDHAITSMQDGCKVLVTDHSYTNVELPRDDSFTSQAYSTSSESSDTTVSTAATERCSQTESNEHEMRNRYTIGYDWDKEVMADLETQRSTFDTNNSLRYSLNGQDEDGYVPSALQHILSSAPTSTANHRLLRKSQPTSHQSSSSRSSVRSSVFSSSTKRSSRGTISAQISSAESSASSSGVVKIKEFSLPSITGRISVHISPEGQVFTPPHLWLNPDIIGREGNGGIIGWGDLLLVEKRRRAAELGKGTEAEDIASGCDGSWNSRGEVTQKRWSSVLSRSKSNLSEQWQHQKRPRGRDAVVRVLDFF